MKMKNIEFFRLFLSKKSNYPMTCYLMKIFREEGLGGLKNKRIIVIFLLFRYFDAWEKT